MKAYESTNTAALSQTVRKAYSKAGFAGALYLLGALALALLAFLPTLNIGGEDLWVATFYLPIQGAFGGKFDWINIITAALYLCILLAVVINFFRCLFKLGRLTSRSSGHINDYNCNMYAMEDMGKRFSSSLAAILNLSLLIYVLQPNASRVAITNYAYVMLGVGLAIHFLAGIIAGKVSWFEKYDNEENVEEVKRKSGIFVYFFRNVAQLAAVAGILYFFLPKCTLGMEIESWLVGVNPFKGNLVKNLVPVLMQALILPCVLVLIKHATATTEFNRFGMAGKGMTNYRAFSFCVFLLAGGAFAFNYFLVQSDSSIYNFVYVAAIAFGVSLVDWIFSPSVNNEEQENDDSIIDIEENQTMKPTVIYQQMSTNQPIYPQPVYIPVYYPYSLQQPAHEYIKPVPFPAEKVWLEALAEENAEPVEVNRPLDPNKEWKVRCPRCGKILKVRETSPYHRCPSCDKVFTLRKFQTYVRKD